MFKKYQIKLAIPLSFLLLLPLTILSFASVSESAPKKTIKNSTNDKLYPEFAFGGKPATLGSQRMDINNTVSFNGSSLKGIVGDFINPTSISSCL